MVLTTYGESHGTQIGGILDGMPSGIEINLDSVQKALDRRRPGQSHLTTERNEEDTVIFHSGLFEGKTTGTPIAFSILNKDHRSEDYGQIKDVFRPSHADFVYEAKYGHRDYRGGGRSSARETACRVVGGALAAQILPNIQVKAWVSAVGPVKLAATAEQLDLSSIDAHPTRCPHQETAKEMETYIEQCRAANDSTGGVITCIATGVPVGLGEPVFDKLQADLAKALMSINAVKGVEIGAGFDCIEQKGTEHRDEMTPEGFLSNNAGGVLGGISSGQPIVASIALKPTSSLRLPGRGIDVNGDPCEVITTGRHDPCVGIRATPIAEAMMAIVLMDHYLRHRGQNADVSVSTPVIGQL